MPLPFPASLATVLAFLTVVAVGSCDFCDAGSRAHSPAAGATIQLGVGGAPAAN